MLLFWYVSKERWVETSGEGEGAGGADVCSGWLNGNAPGLTRAPIVSNFHQWLGFRNTL